MNYELGKTIEPYAQYRQRYNVASSVRLQEKELKRQGNLTKSEAEPQIPFLAHAIDEIKNQGTKAFYMLPDTGFQVQTQVDLLIENYKSGVPLSESLAQVHQDIHHFKIEYLVEQPVFAIPLEFAEYKGEKRLVGNFYNGKPLVDATSKEERHGVVKEMVKKVEDHLKDAKPGAGAMFISGNGWSGYEGIEYPDAQTYCYQVQKDGSIRSFTLKTDLNISQNEEVMRRLGVSSDAFSAEVDDKNRVKRLLRNGLFFDSKDDITTENIAKTLMQVKGINVAYKDSMGKARTFTEMFDLLKNPDPLLSIEDKQKKLTDVLDNYIEHRLGNFDTQTEEDIKIALGYTILSLMHEVRPSQKDKKMHEGIGYSASRSALVSLSPQNMLFELQQIGGCAGGGKKNKSIVDSLTPRIGNNMLDLNQEWFTCPKCSYKADGPIGNTCPGCNLTKEDYASEEGVIVCD